MSTCIYNQQYESVHYEFLSTTQDEHGHDLTSAMVQRTIIKINIQKVLPGCWDTLYRCSVLYKPSPWIVVGERKTSKFNLLTPNKTKDNRTALNTRQKLPSAHLQCSDLYMNYIYEYIFTRLRSYC